MISLDTLLMHGFSFDSNIINWPHNIYQYLELADKHNIFPVLLNSEILLNRNRLQVVDLFANREKLFNINLVVAFCAKTYKPCIIKQPQEGIIELIINDKTIYTDSNHIYTKLLNNDFQLAERNLGFIQMKWHGRNDSEVGILNNVYHKLENIILKR